MKFDLKHRMIFGVAEGNSAKARACAFRAKAEAEEARETAEAAEARRRAEIVSVCDLSDVPDRAAAFIAKGLNASGVLAVLMHEREAAAIWNRLIALHNAKFAEIRH